MISFASSSRRARIRSRGSSGRFAPRSKQPGADPRIAARTKLSSPGRTGCTHLAIGCGCCSKSCSSSTRRRSICNATAPAGSPALLPIDGATIKPVIDDWGRTPQPYVENGATIYPVAYQQVLKGYPAVDYSLRDIIYRPRNIRVNRAYGFSPVEQIVTSVNIALRRQMYLLDYFTQGNIPDSLIGVPENWTPDQIASYQKYWDAYFDGDLGRRRRAKFVPGGVAKTFIQTKEPDLKRPVRRMAGAHRLLRLLDLAAGPDAADEPRDGGDAEGDRGGGGPRADPRLGEGSDRPDHRAGFRRARSRIHLERRAARSIRRRRRRSFRATRRRASSRSTRRAPRSAAIRFPMPPPTSR